ncbi:MAG TPA: glucose-6-phosphate isomerase, partial [Actinomycetota bacterium]|nr:glucose-6-phosphate isomerase [Actinomycetota bacterium]
PAARLAAAIAEAAAGDAWDGRDKVTLVLPDQLRSFGSWLEQLIAESLGKEGKGVIPVASEPLGPLEVYDEDRLFVAYGVGDEPWPAALEAIEAEHPVVRIRIWSLSDLGAECYRWQMATALTAHILDIHPFDQPDVESAKQRSRQALEQSGQRPDPGDAAALLSALDPGDYVGIQAFLTPSSENNRRLQQVRVKIRDRHRVATTAGFGPRFLHSTGQLHKGGPESGVFLQVTKTHGTDVEVPGMGFSFGRLFDAQADGDLQALRDAGRRVARVGIEDLEKLASEGGS